MKDLERLKHMLISDKQFSQEKAKQIILKDFTNCLNNYAQLIENSAKLELNVDQNGIYNITFVAQAERLKTFGTIID